MIPRRYTVRRGKPRQTPRQKLHGFRALYAYYLYLLGGKRPRGRWPAHFSVRADVAILAQHKGGKRIAMLGDMTELGAAEAPGHQSVGELVGQLTLGSALRLYPQFQSVLAGMRG